MESIVKKLFLISTAALAIAVTLTSASTRAIEGCTSESTQSETCIPDLNNANNQTSVGMESTFKFTVDRVFQLKGVTGTSITMNGFIDEAHSISANVASNVPFSINLSATQPDLVSSDSTNNQSIPADANVVANTNAWGIKKDGETDYTALDTTRQKFYSSGTGAAFQPASGTSDDNPGNNFEFPVGVSISPSLPADTYSTAITVTLIDQP